MQWTRMPQESYDSHCKAVKGLEREQKNIKVFFLPKAQRKQDPVK